MSKPTAPEYSDIQALARFGHGRLKAARFLLLIIRDAKQAGEWIQSVPVSSAEWTESPSQTALQIALSAEGLRAIGLSDEVVEGFSEAFISGMSADSNRSRRLGDIGENAPDKWQWGGSVTTVPHLLLMLYAKNGQLSAWSETVMDQRFGQAFTVIADLDTVDSNSIEPFGFADGISQPAIDWERKQSTDLHRRDRFSNLLSLGELLLGYPNEYGQYTERPLIDPASDQQAELLPVAEEHPNLHDLGRNGSYLVMRQLHQDVPAFWRYIDQQVQGDPQEREQLASRMVGRQRDGTPLVGPAEQPVEGINTTGNAAALNQFDFDNDPLGQQCPIGSHIRRSNPRTGDFPPGVTGLLTRFVRIFGFGRKHPADDLIASTRFHRLLRRGRVYGEQLSQEVALKPKTKKGQRGLHFICLVASISRQFEFVQNAWSMGSKFGGVQNENDPLLGNRAPLSDGESTNHFSQPDAKGPAHCIHAMPQFVTVQGGAYFFMPGIRALRYITSFTESRGGPKS
ncbi:MAG: peroxidase [Sedimenticola sp.]|nr:peroxidase [Sedimenticola sp.]